jgi:hypothetical protein
LINYGDNKAQAFSTWTKEFYVNVFVQLFHAIAYILVVNAGVTAYLNDKDWLLLCICVAFLFQGEKILRAIFNIKSSANTIGDLAAAAASVTGMSKIIKDSKLFGDKGKDKEEEVPQATPPRDIPTADTNPLLNENYNREENREEYREESRETENNISGNNNANNQIALDIQRIQNSVLNKAVTSRNKHYKSKFGKFVKKGFKTTGALVGFASGMAVGKRDAVIKNMAIGKEVMGSISSIATGPIRGISNAYTGKKMKNAILNGEMDEEFGFDNDTTDDTKKATQDAYRKALAKMASAAARKGVDAGRAKFWDTMESKNYLN